MSNSVSSISGSERLNQVQLTAEHGTTYYVQLSMLSPHSSVHHKFRRRNKESKPRIGSNPCYITSVHSNLQAATQAG